MFPCYTKDPQCVTVLKKSLRRPEMGGAVGCGSAFLRETRAVHCMSYLSKAVPKEGFGNKKPNAHTCFGKCTCAASAPKAGVRLGSVSRSSGSRCHPHV